MSSEAARWQGVADMLSAAGVQIWSAGAPIHIRAAGGHLVTVRDTWWRKNHDIWTGYQVELSNAADITVRLWPRTKKRSEVLDAVLEAIADASPVVRVHPQDRQQ
jgi:hypothetical protein